jgi:hypothetical protein
MRGLVSDLVGMHLRLRCRDNGSIDRAETAFCGMRANRYLVVVADPWR